MYVIPLSDHSYLGGAFIIALFRSLISESAEAPAPVRHAKRLSTKEVKSAEKIGVCALMSIMHTK